MDTALKKDMYMNYAMLWSGSIGGEASTELVVPDSMPDIGVLVDAEAILSIRSKEADDGYVRAVAELNIKVIYQPEDGSSLRSLPVSMNCDVGAKVPEADLNCQTVIRLRLRSLEAKAINSRKLGIHADISGSACCLRKEEKGFVQSIVLPGAELQVLPQSGKFCLISDVREKTFVISDDYGMPSGCEDPSAILLQRVFLQPDASEFVNGKLVFRGKARVFLLLACAETIHPCYFETPFSQIMEIGGSADREPEIAYELTGAFFDLPEHSGGKISAELHILAQVIAREEKELGYLSDVYSNQIPLEPLMSQETYCTSMREWPLSCSLSGHIEAPADAVSVLYTKSCISGFSADEAGISVSVSAKVIYLRSDSSYACANVRLKEQLDASLSENEHLNICSVQAGDSFASISGGALDVRVPVNLHIQAYTEQAISHVADVRELDDDRQEPPSVTLIYAESQQDLWSVAKKYGSTCDAILKANEGRKEGLLLIPKTR